MGSGPYIPLLNTGSTANDGSTLGKLGEEGIEEGDSLLLFKIHLNICAIKSGSFDMVDKMVVCFL